MSMGGAFRDYILASIGLILFDSKLLMLFAPVIFL